MYPKLINTIDFLAGLVEELAKDLKKEDHPTEADPLLDQLQKEARNLTDIYNEFCWLEMQN